jgi:hypothetical protein
MCPQLLCASVLQQLGMFNRTAMTTCCFNGILQKYTAVKSLVAVVHAVMRYR